jgi:protein tyrosine phosphatase (PTP) superfamily phosphohydrolase (DUF442 family)
MFRLGWMQPGGSTRGEPLRGPSRRGRWAALGLIACMAVVQSGCQSGPFSNCGSGSGLFSPCGFFGRVSARVFNRSNGGCCGSSGVVTDGPVEYAAPSSVVTPGVIPSYPSGSGSSSTSSSVLPMPPDNPSEMAPVETTPRSKIVTPPANGASSALPGKQSYQTRRPDFGSRIARQRNDNLTKTLVSTPEPTSRSAQAPSRSASNDNDAQDPLDHLPPLDLPGDVTKSSASPPVPPAADQTAKPAPEDEKKPTVDGGSSALSAEPSDLTTAAAVSGQSSPPASAGPGPTRFAAVDLKLAGGSAPATDGLKWLVDKGYRTVLDLRESREVPPSFIAEVTNLGLRYVALPISLNTIDRGHVDRFNFEVATGEARPLFFFDSDGTRAGALWYIRRITVDRVDHQIARREAEELGLTNKNYWAAATGYVAGVGGEPRTTSTPEPKPQGLGQDPATPAMAVPSLNSVSAGTPGRQASAPDLPAPPISSDSVAWRPLAAMVVTGLTLPLAYWSRTLTPTILAKTRASLPAPAHRPKSLPGVSGE